MAATETACSGEDAPTSTALSSASSSSVSSASAPQHKPDKANCPHWRQVCNLRPGNLRHTANTRCPAATGWAADHGVTTPLTRRHRTSFQTITGDPRVCAQSLLSCGTDAMRPWPLGRRVGPMPGFHAGVAPAVGVCAVSLFLPAVVRQPASSSHSEVASVRVVNRSQLPT